MQLNGITLNKLIFFGQVNFPFGQPNSEWHFSNGQVE